MKYGKKFNPYGLFTGLFVPNRVAQSYLPDSCKILLGRLYQYAGQNGVANPKRNTLAKELGWDIRKLDRTIRTLKDEEVIDTARNDSERHEGKASHYIFLYHRIYDQTQETRPDKNDSTPTDKNDSSPYKKRKKNKKKVVKTTPLQHSLSVGEVSSSKKVTIKTLTLYKELIDLGAVKHRKESKAETKSLHALHCLLKKSCRTPIHKSILKEYMDKTWSIDEIKELFGLYISKGGKERSISNFIYTNNYGRNAYSPLIETHKKKLKWLENAVKFNGMAKRLAYLYHLHFPALDTEDQLVFIKAGKHVKKSLKKFTGNKTLMYPRDNFEYQFMLYIKERLEKEDFRLRYISGKAFMEDFIKIGIKRGAIVPKGIMR